MITKKLIAETCLPILEEALRKMDAFTDVDMAIEYLRKKGCALGVCWLFYSIKGDIFLWSDLIKNILSMHRLKNGKYWLITPYIIYHRGGSINDIKKSLKKRIEILKKAL